MMKKIFTLLLLLSVSTWSLFSQVRLQQYGYQTGVDASKWITLPADATVLLSNASTDVSSSVTNLGFDFQFGNQVYTQFSVNSNGVLHFGSDQADGYPSYFAPFSVVDAETNLPKIDGYGSTTSAIMTTNGYVKYALTGVAPNRIFVVEYSTSYSGITNDINWQVQLSETTNNILIIYGPTRPSMMPSDFQIGMAASIDEDDILSISDNNTLITGYNNIPSMVWPAPNTYYQFTMPNCLGPIDLSVDNVTENSVDVNWTAAGTSSEWQYVCVPTGTLPDWSTAITTNSTSVTINQLQASSKYDFYIRTICSPTDQSAETKFTFQTACTATALPYSENFDLYTEDVSHFSSAPDNYPNHALPACWHFNEFAESYYSGGSVWLTDAQSTEWAINSIDNISMKMEASSLVVTYAALPMMEASVDQLQLSFDYLSDAYIHEFYVGVMTDPNDFSTFITLDTLPAMTYRFHADHTFSYDNLDIANDYYIAIAMNHRSGSLAIDNIVVDYAPTCITPQDVAISDLSITSATISCNVSAPTFQVAYRVDNQDWSYAIANTNPFILTSLTPATEYQLKVRAICAAGDTSAWSNLSYFSTECPIYTLPFVSDFSNLDDEITNLVCWKFYTGLGQNVLAGTEQLKETTYTKWDYSEESLEYPHPYINIYGNTRKDWMVSPSINITSDAELSFEATFTRYSSNTSPATGDLTDDKFWVLVSNNNGASWSILSTWGTRESDNYSWQSLSINPTTFTFSLTDYNNQTVQIAFYVESTEYGGDNDLHIGNITISPLGPTCDAPTMLSATAESQSATLSWQGEASHFELSIFDTEVSDWAAPISVDTTYYILNDLIPSTEYRYRVRQVCGEDFYSNWTEASFTTQTIVCQRPVLSITHIGTNSATFSCDTPLQFLDIEYSLFDATDTIVNTVSDNPFSLIDLQGFTDYHIAIRVQCVETIYSDWSDTLDFTTLDCYPITNLTVSDITETTANLAWVAGGEEREWVVSYGEVGFIQGEGTDTIVDIPSLTISQLNPHTDYEVFVRARCADDFHSVWSSASTFTTKGSVEGIDAINGNFRFSIYPNPASNAITINLSDVAETYLLNIVDMSGRTLISRRLSTTATQRIDVSQLSQGTYFVQLIGDHVNSVRKLIIR